MAEAGVPTARARTCGSLAEAKRAIDELADDEKRVVIKASGLAAGKGVVVATSIDEARRAAASMLSDRAFGEAGDTVLVEEFMNGEELSLFALTDGERVVTLPASQDHKRLNDGDRGPNTGGMGAYCPVSLADAPGFTDDVVDRIVRPTLAALNARGTPFTGLLYVGLMMTADGPKVVEFNCRFGDPGDGGGPACTRCGRERLRGDGYGGSRRTPLGTRHRRRPRGCYDGDRRRRLSGAAAHRRRDSPAALRRRRVRLSRGDQARRGRRRSRPPADASWQ